MSLPTLLLTRPKAQALPVQTAVQAALGFDVCTVFSPVLQIERREVAVDLDRYGGVIVTSVHGVATMNLTGRVAHCVGARTAEAALEIGARQGQVGRDADDLVEQILSTGTPGPLIHLRGEHTRGDIAARLSSAGIETHEAVVYAQSPLPLTAPARDLIEGEGVVVLPLYSPRSARLVGQAVDQVGPNVRVIAFSPSVANAFQVETGRMPDVCATPVGTEMVGAIVAAFHADIA